jgi:transcription elongation factor Elf1
VSVKITYSDDGVECPHCGHVHEDSWEITGNDDCCHTIECDQCGCLFECWSITSVAYEARPVPVGDVCQPAPAKP